MFILSKPSAERVQDLLVKQRHQACSYVAVGATRAQPPAGYDVDHNRIELGSGAEVYASAVAAIRSWQMFTVGWCQLFNPDTPIEEGRVVAVAIYHFGFWSLNPSRIVYVVEESGPVERFGFAYGTLREHAESGEERFTVEWDHATDAVTYDIFAFSRPRHVLARLGYPLCRMLQRCFVEDSKQAMLRVVH
jgi:uncharacterized protein (UPF0548 family)